MNFKIQSALQSIALLAVVSTVAAQNEPESSPKIKVENVQNELLIASLGKANATQQEKQSDISEADLEKANRKLKAAEERLIAQSKQGSSTASDGQSEDRTRTGDAKSEEPSSQAQASINLKKVDEADLPGKESDAELALNKAPALPDRSAEFQAAIQALEQRNAELEKQLSLAEDRANSTAKDLDETRNRLMIAETQVERLSSIIGNVVPKKAPAAAPKTRSLPAIQAQRKTVPQPQTAQPVDDMQVVTVVVDKANLRVGPSKDNSPIMAVPKGTQLAVETRKDEWYRVLTPTGGRAWISADAVSFRAAADTVSGSFGNRNLNERADLDTFDFAE